MGHGERIALVEDNEHLRKWLGTLLTRKGYVVTSFPNGAEALVGILDDRPDLVLSDYQMPQLDGIGLCQALRARFDKGQLPFILISVMDGEDEILAGLEAGANDYLVKPFPTALVLAKIALNLKQRTQPETSAEAPLAQNPQTFPFELARYELLGRLGEGSYGSVYRARVLGDEDGQEIALKLLDQQVGRDREMLARYFREVAVLSGLQCETIVRFIEAGYARRRYFIAMELADGESAWDLLQKDGPFEPIHAVYLGEDMAKAILALSEKGLIHRDLKPANVVASGDRYILIDFGLAKDRSETALTQPDEFLGTAEYIAPEVIAGSRESVASDIYGLGVTLWELLVGYQPFRAHSTMEILKRVASFVPAPTVHSQRAEVPEVLSDLVAKLMAPDPRDRLTDPSAVLAEFQSVRAQLS